MILTRRLGLPLWINNNTVLSLRFHFFDFFLLRLLGFNCGEAEFSACVRLLPVASRTEGLTVADELIETGAPLDALPGDLVDGGHGDVPEVGGGQTVRPVSPRDSPPLIYKTGLPLGDIPPGC